VGASARKYAGESNAEQADALDKGGEALWVPDYRYVCACGLKMHSLLCVCSTGDDLSMSTTTSTKLYNHGNEFLHHEDAL
jgi:hypothetical protein